MTDATGFQTRSATGRESYDFSVIVGELLKRLLPVVL
jgi:hypothetical protein